MLSSQEPFSIPSTGSDSSQPSDLAAEYYEKHVFDGRTFGDMEARKSPLILMNATDMTHRTRVGFTQEAFNLICSDLSKFPVARAAASSYPPR